MQEHGVQEHAEVERAVAVAAVVAGLGARLLVAVVGVGFIRPSDNLQLCRTYKCRTKPCGTKSISPSPRPTQAGWMQPKIGSKATKRNVASGTTLHVSAPRGPLHGGSLHGVCSTGFAP